MGFVAAAIVLFILFKIWRYRRKRKKLFKKYGNMGVVRRIMNNDVWEGQTAPQLLDSFGKPAAVDRSVYKSSSKETWKYAQKSKSRYAVKIQLEDGIVVGFETKGS